MGAAAIDKAISMPSGPTPEETALFDEITEIAEAVWDKSKVIAGTIFDPKFVAVVLFRRLRSHHQAYAVLWKHECCIESEIIVRSAIETTICIAANFRMGDEFPRLMRRDAAKTLEGQIKLYRDAGNADIVKSSEAALRFLQAGFAEGEKAAFLDWKTLAEVGQTPQLYDFHKMLSGLSSHVTGLSLIRGIGDDETEALQDELIGLSKRNYFNMMAGATLQGSLIQSDIIDDAELADRALALIDCLNTLSMSWPSN